MGLAEVPQAGDLFYAVEDEKMARELAEQRKAEEKAAQAGKMQKVSLDDLFNQIQQGDVKSSTSLSRPTSWARPRRCRLRWRS